MTLEVRGRWTAFQAQAVALAGVIALISSLFASFAAARAGALPWGLDPRLLVPVLVGGELVATVAGLLVLRALWARVGSATLRDDRVVLEKDGASFELLLAETAGFRDDSPGFVALVREGDRSRLFAVDVWTATIPTPTERERTAVLGYLAERGIRRLA